MTKHPFSRFFGLGDKEQNVDRESEIETEKEEINHDEIHKLPISSIVPNRFQPRSIFDDEKIEELALTIETHGIIQPIVVREIHDGQFEIIAGERRYRAISKLGWDKIPAIINNLSDTETASVALIENLQREELSPIEEAVAYSKLIELHQLTQEGLANRLGIGQSTVANKIRLLKLPQVVQNAVMQKAITERHARSLIPLKDPEKQAKLVEEIIDKGLNVKQTEERVNKLLSADEDKKPRAIRKAFSKDMRIAVNTIRQSMSMVKDNGINLDSEETEFDDFYQITIRIPKKRK
ncbi:nucleoid occlusion protein [Pradoshia sp. D12]|uniref:nucleoid occlusion protein n=1 Tax=Bacillaceae TaxID=186817 RepID=UPI00080AE58D|nr:MULTISPECIES: nucleoid occlusion protein [Bacillaceae]OCA81203.1 nucleoid occlusion protein [Bacillus sp. FJAT-27986]QFK73136.1 nucleoid occlusion protein [Pradoshia sp. D12]TPF72129.1 nucleoid occlusion protein [Bacillus sp. D12]